ncbi:hypothetical protein BO82DRAFT_399668 [Aspergillus uvarum CBS 121591]|uniref:PRISE-like Rossmann-fold domain-containing protein n=1 Tax=Aspergillus uvarum CBS 121591 TaxID=1448315 RepID=A0A319CFK1_9EURO|nr:hypothetical protein BO82DRAFT_399668 [Aspergillus uvarum CBS 121591]PYH84425.1 hypothetical protein BO82DRAFT_399668 [Aspergillus uvarum CBS 121591]
MISVEEVHPACNNHALVFGASGITGLTIVNALLHDYPERAWLSSPMLQHVEGLNLLQGTHEEPNAQINSSVPDVSSITTVFCAYLEERDMEAKTTTNTRLLKRAVSAVEAPSSELRFVMITWVSRYAVCKSVHIFCTNAASPLH